MKILLVAATRAEVEPFCQYFALEKENLSGICGKNQVKVLLSGVGMVATAFAMGSHLAVNDYDLAINCGIAGSFDPELNLGDICRVTRDVFAEFGAEDGEQFIRIDRLGLAQSIYSESLPTGYLTEIELIPVSAITVNKVHGNELSIAKVLEELHPQIESMEGAAFFYACHQKGLSCIQVRSISNYVERRDREKWDIALAIKNLNSYLIQKMEQ